MTRITVDSDEKPERTLTAYRYDPKTHLYCGVREVVGEYIAGGGRAYLLRPHETLEEPPDVMDGEQAVYLERFHQWGRKDS